MPSASTTAINPIGQLLLNVAVLTLGHGVLNNLAIDVFTGGLGFWSSQKLSQRDGFCRGLNHQLLTHGYEALT